MPTHEPIEKRGFLFEAMKWRTSSRNFEQQFIIVEDYMNGSRGITLWDCNSFS